MTQVVALRRQPCGCLVAALTNEQLARSMKAAFPGQYRVARLPRRKAWIVRCRHTKKSH